MYKEHSQDWLCHKGERKSRLEAGGTQIGGREKEITSGAKAPTLTRFLARLKSCPDEEIARLTGGGWEVMTANATTKSHPGVGDAAPDFVYQDGAGNERRLSELWGEGPALIVWLRHFG